jgi:hypothetical protein
MAMINPNMGMYGTHDTSLGKGSIDRDVELFRRICEAKSKQGVELIRDMDHYGGMHQTRVYFRQWGVYLMVDLDCLHYGSGEAQISQIAEHTVRMAEEHIKQKDSRLLDEAYRSMASYEPDWQHKKGATAPSQQVQLNKREAMIQQQMQSNSQGIAAPKGSINNPLRVELQKKVDAWLK